MKRLCNSLLFAGLFVALLITSCKKLDVPGDGHGTGHIPDVLPNNVILDWNYTAFECAGGAAEAHALLAVRSDAMVHIAMHDALNAIVPIFKQYAYHQSNESANPIAACAKAAHTVLITLWPDSASMLDLKLAASLSAIPDGAGKTRGINLGTDAGNAILNLRAGDGAYQDPIGILAPSTVPGVYVGVPPTPFAFAPFWKTMQLFSLDRHDQFREGPPPALTSPLYTRDFNEVKEIGKLNSTVRSAEQTFYAKFWYEFSDIGWNRIARVLSTEHPAGLYTTARMFALLNMALADSYTAGWDTKYYYNFWRPYTAIRAASTDGNPATVEEPTWEPGENTPPVPDYTSTHSTLGNAGATVLEAFFGNHTSFTTTSSSAMPAGASRSFSSLKQAANENADSRVVCGIHFRFSCELGQAMGNKIGKWTLVKHLGRRH